ncbi:MAG: transposase [Deltaproteobacteria bacterium]|nr:transposase [Deltaproteobacteria bacterium]MBN2672057.1 transposase [Deltaproteobacteria bacterium]
MTLPRQFLKNTTYFVTRRITQRQHWLKPTQLNKQIFLYCLAVAAQKTSVQIHAVCVLSNHWHGIFFDPNARIAEFYGWVHEYVAKAINCSHGRWENLWSSDKTSVIALESHVDVMDKIAYTLCNPVSAQLVAQAKYWKGVWLYANNHSQTIKRPNVYFREDGDMPEFVSLEVTMPPCFEGLTPNTYEKLVETEITRREEQIAEEMQQNRKRFLGMDAVMKQSFSERPKNPEPRRRLNPRVAAKDKWLRINAIRRYKQFVSDYWSALKEWKNGNRDVFFPPGTYALRIHVGVNVQPG